MTLRCSFLHSTGLDNPPLERTAAAVYFTCGGASRVCRRGRSTAFRYPAPSTCVQTLNSISDPMQRVLANELRQGEVLFWREQPRPGALARRSSTTFLFGIPFFAFAVFWTIAASGGFSKVKSGSFPSWFPVLWGSMFIIAGAAMLLSPAWAYLKALRTVYAITDQRAILIVATLRRTVHSFVGQHLVDIHRVENDAGHGDIIFHRQARSGKRGDYYYDVGFFGIDRVREVEEALRELHEATRAG